MDDLTYQQGLAEYAAINDELRSAWQSLPDSATFKSLLATRPELARLDFGSAPPYSIERKQAGLTPELTLVLVKIIVPVGIVVTQDFLKILWKQCILPRIRSRLGVEVLKDPPKD